MKVKIRKVGNSLGILLPRDTLKLLGLDEHNQVDLTIKNRQIELVLSKARK